MAEKKPAAKRSWIAAELLRTGPIVALLGWVAITQFRQGQDIAKIQAVLEEKVTAADRLHMSFATHDELRLAIVEARLEYGRDLDARFKELSDQLGIRYRGPVNNPGTRWSIFREKWRKRAENHSGD